MINFSQAILGCVLVLAFLAFVFALITKRVKITVISSIIMGIYIFGNMYLHLFSSYPY